jgi:hypothetical protein
VVLSAHSALQGGEATHCAPRSRFFTRRSRAAKPPIARLVRVVLYIGSKIIKKCCFLLLVYVRIWHHIRQGRGEARRMEQRERGRKEGETRRSRVEQRVEPLVSNEWSNEAKPSLLLHHHLLLRCHRASSRRRHTHNTSLRGRRPLSILRLQFIQVTRP